MIPQPEPVVSDPLDEWHGLSADALLAAVAAVPPEAPVPNFTGIRETVGFWSRRQLHEVTVHLQDLLQAGF